MNIAKPTSIRDFGAAHCGIDVIDAIYGRRATRAYTTQRVERRTVLALLDAAVQAPSAVNQQPWSFVVIQAPDMLRRLSERAKALSLVEAQPGTPLWEHRHALQNPDFSVFYDAGTLVVVCAGSGMPHSNEDCCLAAQNLMLAAHGLGLATCPIGFARVALNEPEAKHELGIPPDDSVVMPLIVGYPREQPAVPPRSEARVLSWN